jgi:hypothetical protein
LLLFELVLRKAAAFAFALTLALTLVLVPVLVLVLVLELVLILASDGVPGAPPNSFLPNLKKLLLRDFVLVGVSSWDEERMFTGDLAGSVA